MLGKAHWLCLHQALIKQAPKRCVFQSSEILTFISRSGLLYGAMA